MHNGSDEQFVMKSKCGFFDGILYLDSSESTFQSVSLVCGRVLCCLLERLWCPLQILVKSMLRKRSFSNPFECQARRAERSMSAPGGLLT